MQERGPRRPIVMSKDEYDRLLMDPDKSNPELISWMRKNNINFNQGILTRSRSGVDTHVVTVLLDGEIVNISTEETDFGTVVITD